MNEIPGKSGSQLRWDYLQAAILAAILYYISVAPGVLWQDSGMAQIRVLTGDYTGQLGLALAHPLFYMLAKVFQYLPFSDSAFKTNLVSATAGILTVANVYLLLYWLIPETSNRRFSAALGAVSLALAHTFWQHAALAEVYTLSTFILTIELLALVKFTQSGRLRWWLLAWFLNGLECSNHMLAVITLVAIVVWSIGLVWSGQLKARWFAPAILLWVIGNLPYEILGFLTWRAGESVPAVIHSMLFGKYQKQVLNVGFSLGMLINATGTVGLNFPTPNILLIPLGLVKGRKLIGRSGRSMWSLLLLATVLHLMFAVRYPVRDQYTFFIIPVLFLAIWLGVGGAYLLGRRPRFALVVGILAVIAPVIYAALPRLAGERLFTAEDVIPYRNEAQYFLWPWKTGYRGPELFARELLATVPPGSYVISDSTARRPITYYQHPLVENLAPTVKVGGGLFGQVDPEHRPYQLERLLEDHSVFVVRPYVPNCPKWIVDNFNIEPAGLIFRITTRKAKQNETKRNERNERNERKNPRRQND